MIPQTDIKINILKYGLYVVSTPIGNLGDITLRAIEVLKKSEYILCEDTRISKKLFERYNIKSKLISNHKFNDVLNNFSNSDITYNLNFKLIEKIAKKFNLKVTGTISQKKFLTNLGILKRAEIIAKKLSFSKKADIYFRVKRLIDKSSMGELFKVMLITKKNIKFKTGFVD